MSDECGGPRLTRRRLLGGMATTGAAAAVGGAGTVAYFHDEETSSDNSVRAGTFDLTLSDGDEGFGDGASESITIENAKPGDAFQGFVTLQNDGSIEADHVELSFSYDEQEGSGPNGNDEADTAPTSADGMAEQIEVTDLDYNSTTISLSDANGNGRVDLGDLANGDDGALDGLTPPPSANGGTQILNLELEFADDPANNDVQGDELTFTVTFALHQDSSQDL